MRFSENRRLAASVLVAVVILSILLSGGGGLMREAFLGGNIYFCVSCQK